MYPGEVLWLLLFACWNVVLIYNDLRYRRVPNTLIVVGFVAQLLWLLAAAFVPGWTYPPRWTGWLLCGAGFLAALLFLPLWGRRLMGAGDVKAIAILGLWLGLAPLILVMVLASLLAGVHALAYVVVSRYWAVSHRLRQIPYAMYLGVAALSVVLMPLNSPWYSWCSSWCSTAS
nr:A24 family peptidase [uncultured Achromobacter sp.]